MSAAIECDDEINIYTITGVLSITIASIVPWPSLDAESSLGVKL